MRASEQGKREWLHHAAGVLAVSIVVFSLAIEAFRFEGAASNAHRLPPAASPRYSSKISAVYSTGWISRCKPDDFCSAITRENGVSTRWDWRNPSSTFNGSRRISAASTSPMPRRFRFHRPPHVAVRFTDCPSRNSSGAPKRKDDTLIVVGPSR